MTADLEAVHALAQVVGVVDGPAREPQHLALELAQDGELVDARLAAFDHPHHHVVPAKAGTHYARGRYVRHDAYRPWPICAPKEPVSRNPRSDRARRSSHPMLRRQ